MPTYRSTGELTDVIPHEGVAVAQEYLTQDDMTQYLDEPLSSAVELIEWNLHHDGHAYHVTAVTNRELTNSELKQLAEWASGQNSDGLGEGFEQQDFAWVGESYNDWGDEEGDGHMVSFDWQTNDSTFTRV